MAGRTWTRMPLGDFVTLQRGHDLPEVVRRPGNKPVLGSFGVTGWHDEARSAGPGVTVGRSGASLGVVSYSPVDYWPLNTALYVTDFHGNDQLFAYYFLKQFDFRVYNSGSAQPSLNRNFIHPVPVDVPPLSEQRAIAHVLGTLDDKIALNRRMNETLEAMARALFKDWFVDFGPTRAKIEGRDPYLASEIWDLFPDKLDDGRKPEGWAYRPVSAFSKIKGGKQLTKDNFVESGPHPVFGGAGIMGYTDRSNADGFVISVGRVGAYCGQFFSFRGKAWINNNASQISPFEAVSGEWLLLNLRALDIDLIKKGAAQPFVSNSDIAAMKIIDPGEKVLESFHEIIAPLAAVRENNDRENSILTSMRNLLLPGLMSGEVRIADADRIVKEFT